MTNKKNEIAVNNSTFMAVGMIDTAKFAVISDKETKAAASAVARAMTTEDASKGAQAYFINQIHKRIASGETIENEKKLGDAKPAKNLPDFCARYFGLSRSQAFNLSRAGAMLKVTVTEDTHKVIYTDVFTNDFSTPNFSNTVLIRFADFIGDTNDKDAEKAQAAKGRFSYIHELVKNGKIKPAMSVSEIMGIVKGTDAGETKGTENEDSKDSKDKENSKGKAEKKEIQYAVPLTKDDALKLKTEMLRFTSNKDYAGKLPMMTAFLNALNEAMKK